MMKTTLKIRPGATAIAAVLALSSTPLWAQETAPPEVPPATSEPAPVTVSDPAPATTEIATDPAPAAEAAPKATAAPKKTVRKSAPVKAAAPAVAAAAAVPAPTAPTPVAEAPPAEAPIAAPVAEVAPPPPEPTAQPIMDEGSAQAAFGGALALLVLGGGALALSRRRRERVTEEYAEDAYEPVTAETLSPEPASIPVAASPAGSTFDRSAFAWGKAAPAASPAAAAAASTGGSWTERARRGPSPDNPSLSLKKRLKRATFFEQREREIAAGLAKPVAADAGLPEPATQGVGQPVAASSRSFERVPEFA